MTNLREIILYCILAFTLGAIGGWLGTEHLIAAMKIEGIDLIFTGIMDIIHLKLKIMILFGLIGALTVMGALVSKRIKINFYCRLLIIIVPTLVVSASALYVKRLILLNAVDMAILSKPIGFSIKALRIETVPFMGLVTAFIVVLLMQMISKRDQQ